MSFYTNTWIALLIKLQALALFTLLTYINYITSISLIIFWYYFLAPVTNLWKQTHLQRYVTVSLSQSLFYQMYTLITDLCLLLLNLKMPLTVGNLGFIWKYKRYAIKSQNNATTNQIILKTVSRREWPSGLKHCRWIGKFLAQILVGVLPVLSCYEALWWPSSQNKCSQNKCSD